MARALLVALEIRAARFAVAMYGRKARPSVTTHIARILEVDNSYKFPAARLHLHLPRDAVMTLLEVAAAAGLVGCHRKQVLMTWLAFRTVEASEDLQDPS